MPIYVKGDLIEDNSYTSFPISINDNKKTEVPSYDIIGDLQQAATQSYSLSGNVPLDFISDGSNSTISISGNETQASNQAYTTSDTSPLSFNADGTDLTALSMDGNMNQASSQPYTVSGTSPISFRNNGTAIDYTISGSMNQTGTPTPTSPITPQECGDRTNQLIPYPYYQPDGALSGVTWTTYSDGRVVGFGKTSAGTNFAMALDLALPNGTYTIAIYGAHSGMTLYLRDTTASEFLVDIPPSASDASQTFTVTQPGVHRLYFNTGQTDRDVDIDCYVMLTTGSTLLSYEPFGYKIPITNAGYTYNVYISEPLRKIGDYVDSMSSDGTVTRRIKKIVFTGNENFTKAASNPVFTMTLAGANSESGITTASTHYAAQTNVSGTGNMNNLSIAIRRGYNTLYIGDDSFADAPAFKTWLAEQYAAGTPITIWYVLATAQTDIATTPAITPVLINNTLSVDTTLAPSNITITSNSSVFPGNPIIPVECGVKTENLFNKDATPSQIYVTDSDQRIGIEIPLSAGTYTASGGTGTLFAKTKIGNVYGTVVELGVVQNFTLTSDGYILIYAEQQSDYDAAKDSVMLNFGSTTLPYEPYGKYKIPITVGSTTKNIFINQPIRKIGDYSDSISSEGVIMRNIKKLVLDGTENWTKNDPNFYIQSSDIMKSSAIVCSHYKDYMDYTVDLSVTTNRGTKMSIWFNDSEFATTQQWKQFLADQYAAGTPITIWYVLATPDTTETTAIPTISTVSGANTLIAQTDITPSNITISTSSSVYPKNPIYPEECGDLVESGEHAGEYAIPITNAGNTYNIYVTEPLRKIGDYADTISSDGTVTRRIKKLVLTGQDGGVWSTNPSIRNGNGFYNLSIFTGYKSNSGVGYCTHYPLATATTDTIGVFFGQNINFITDFAEGIDTADKWKSYLAQQYAAGTPVTVWYVLATPTTETIGAPTITTSVGVNTLSINTTLAPSSVTITASGSVAPYNPIIPEECGERTANLFDKDNTTVYNAYFDNAGTWRNSSDSRSIIIPAKGNTTYTLSVQNNLAVFRIYQTSNLMPQIGDTLSAITRSENINSYTFTTAANTVNIAFQGSAAVVNEWIATLVLNEGSSPLPYEPYGYKIPVTNAGQTYNVYVSEPLRKIRSYSDTVGSDGVATRQIYKKVFDGTEAWNVQAADEGRNRFYLSLSNAVNSHSEYQNSVCTHLPLLASGGTYSKDNGYTIASELIYMRLTAEYDSLTDFKAFLAQQYAAGTPVTVWYVLETPTTETITSPTLSLELNTTNILDINTSLKPSQFDMSYYREGYTTVTKIPILDGTEEVKCVLDENGRFIYKSPRYYN